MVGNFNTPFKPIQTENKEVTDLHVTLEEINLTHIYTSFHPKIAEYKLFSSTHGTFFRTGDTLGHKTSLQPWLV